MEKYLTIVQLLLFPKRRERANVNADLFFSSERSVAFMSHLHKNADRKKLVLSEAAQDLTKEQHKNDTMLKENNK